jgi:hypothetical protein
MNSGTGRALSGRSTFWTVVFPVLTPLRVALAEVRPHRSNTQRVKSGDSLRTRRALRNGCDCFMSSTP